jgi:hypothetical protein
MSYLITSSGQSSVIQTSEATYLNSFVHAGDRGGMYMAYYSFVGSDDTIAFSSDFGKHEVSLQT